MMCNVTNGQVEVREGRREVVNELTKKYLIETELNSWVNIW